MNYQIKELYQIEKFIRDRIFIYILRRGNISYQHVEGPRKKIVFKAHSNFSSNQATQFDQSFPDIRYRKSDKECRDSRNSIREYYT